MASSQRFPKPVPGWAHKRQAVLEVLSDVGQQRQDLQGVTGMQHPANFRRLMAELVADGKAYTCSFARRPGEAAEEFFFRTSDGRDVFLALWQAQTEPTVQPVRQQSPAAEQQRSARAAQADIEREARTSARLARAAEKQARNAEAKQRRAEARQLQRQQREANVAAAKRLSEERRARKQQEKQLQAEAAAQRRLGPSGQPLRISAADERRAKKGRKQAAEAAAPVAAQLPGESQQTIETVVTKLETPADRFAVQPWERSGQGISPRIGEYSDEPGSCAARWAQRVATEGRS